MKTRNVILGYFLNFIKYSWFFTGVWVFYYLRFTNYAGIGLIETVLIISMTLMEIPTGAIADLIGKKITLSVSFFLETLCYLLMGLSNSLGSMLFAVFIGAVGGTLFSGTLEALIYDTLFFQKQEADYNKIVARNTSVQLAAIIVSGLLSGYLYQFNPSAPFFVSSFVSLIGLLLTFFLVEPKIDTSTFNIKNFMVQTQQGFKGLFSTPLVSVQSILFLIITGILVIADEMGESFLGVEFGFRPENIGVFFSFVFLVAAIISQLTPKINHYLSSGLIIILGIATAFTFMISPFAGIILGGFTLVVRQSLATTLNNLTSIYINQNTESKYRATTISTFNMIKNLPYAASAYFIGSLMDTYSARNVAFYMGLTILVSLLVFYLINGSNSKKNSAKLLSSSTG